MDPLQHVKKNKEMRRKGQASDQNKIISTLFSFSSSQQSRNMDLDVREGELWKYKPG